LKDQDEKQRAYFRNRIETDPSPTYGDGFREAMFADQSLGLPVLLEYLMNNGATAFPNV
jgi:hypothetical protein